MSEHSRSEPVYLGHDLASAGGDWSSVLYGPGADPVHAAARKLLEALGPLIRTGRMKGPTGAAIEELERALAGAAGRTVYHFTSDPARGPNASDEAGRPAEGSAALTTDPAPQGQLTSSTAPYGEDAQPATPRPAADVAEGDIRHRLVAGGHRL